MNKILLASVIQIIHFNDNEFYKKTYFITVFFVIQLPFFFFLKELSYDFNLEYCNQIKSI